MKIYKLKKKKESSKNNNLKKTEDGFSSKQYAKKPLLSTKNVTDQLNFFFTSGPP